MRKITSLALLVSITLLSCQKELSFEQGTTGNNGGSNTGGNNNGGTNASLTGTWKFDGIQASTNVEIVADMGGVVFKTITKSAYNTKQNTGTYTFSTEKFTGTNVGYSIDTTFVGYTYIDGVFQDSIVSPMQVPLMIQSSSTTYKLVGTDSIYFTSGSLTINSGSAGPSSMAAQPSGMKYKISGNILTMSFSYLKDTTIVNAGTPMVVKQVAGGSVRLIK